MPLISVVQQLALARDLPRIQQIVRTAARELTGADGATFVLRDSGCCYYVDEDAISPLWKGMRFPLETCISGWSMIHRQAAVVPDIYADSRIPVEAYRPTFVKSLVMVPIRSLDPIGAIGNYWATYHEASEEEIRVLQALADATAVAMENVRVYAELEQRVRERTSELEAAREAAQRALEIAERANSAKSRFLATASHDLRQPLQSLSLLNGSLRRMIRDPAAAQALAQQELAISASSRLVNTLLDISKLESGAIRPEITDFALTELLAELREEFAGLAANKGLEFTVESCAARVRSDPALLGQVLRNLVSNAIKYTRVGAVTLRCAPVHGSARVQVLDTGIGIPAEHLPHIFDEFYQVGVPQNRSREGFGLGLSIVDRVVRLLNLKLEVDSQPGQGSAFSLDLPLSAAQGIEPARAAVDEARAGRADSRGRRVLLVEDDRGVREATRLLLESLDCQVSAAATPAEALERAAEGGAPDLVISDYHLDCPQTGLDVIAALREKFGPQLNAILVTGDTSPAIKGLLPDRHMRLAAKPVETELLLQLMSDLIDTNRTA